VASCEIIEDTKQRYNWRMHTMRNENNPNIKLYTHFMHCKSEKNWK